MNAQELTRAILLRITKRWIWIFCLAIFFSILMVFYAKHSPVFYTSSATIFPLTSGSDNSTNSVLNALMGSGDNGKSFTDENSVNITELAMSRTTREEVARKCIPSMGNKTIAQLLLEEYQKDKSLFEKVPQVKLNDSSLIYWASGILKKNLNASISKTSSFILNYSGRDPELVRIISYAFIDKISAFYIELKREKAKRDFEFATCKVDSLRQVMNSKDKKLIAMDERTLFTNTLKLQYRVPTENVMADKQMVRAQYANAVANQQNAAYKLQKATPVIKVLDTPEPPYDKSGKSVLIYGIIGFVAGMVIAIFFIISPVLFRYGTLEYSRVVNGTVK